MIAAFIQARMSSTRLPGKVLRPILGRPMLALEIERVQRCKSVNRIVVVTSVSPEDKQIVDLCLKLKIDCFCGSLENVLDRFYQAAKKYNPDHILRLTADCPFIDAKVVDEMVNLYLKEKSDYGTNCMPPTYPDGLDAEIFSFEALESAHRDAVLPSHLEHISLFFEEQPNCFKISNLAHGVDLSNMRWTVDEPADFKFAEKVFEALYPAKPGFNMYDVLDLLKGHPELALLNKNIARNKGVAKTKEKDKQFLR